MVGSCWLFAHRRPVWYTLLPALFMLVTSVSMLLRLIAQHLPDWPDKAPLVVAEFVVLAMTVGIVALIVVRWRRMHQERQIALAGGA